MRILVIGLGGTIGSVKSDKIGLDSNNLKILGYCKRDDVEFEGVTLFSVLSENMSFEFWKRLLEYLDKVDYSKYEGVIVLHGSDTLAYTSALIFNAFPHKKIALVAADKPVEDKTSNGFLNFNNAVDGILNGEINCPTASYNGLFKGNCVCNIGASNQLVYVNNKREPVSCCKIVAKNILIINPYVEINFDNYNLNNVDCVLFTMYHSATVAQNTVEFCNKLKQKEIDYYFVTHCESAQYESSAQLDNIIFSTTVENEYAKLLLTK